jgi:hypothetical protein
LAAYNQPLLMAPLLVLIQRYNTITRSGLVARALTKGAFACQMWQWGAALALSLGSLFVSPTRLIAAAQLPLLTFLALPPMTLLAVVAATSSREKQPRQTAVAG